MTTVTNILHFTDKASTFSFCLTGLLCQNCYRLGPFTKGNCCGSTFYRSDAVRVFQPQRVKLNKYKALRITNGSANSEPMTSHALGGLAGSQWTLVHMQQ